MKALLSLIVLSLACLTACEAREAEGIDYGTVENSVYRNQYLGFRLTLPADWSVQDQAARENLMDRGGAIVAGDDQNLKAQIKASELQSVYLLAAFQYPVGAPQEFNPSLSCVAERLDHSPGIKRGSDYLFHTRKVMESGQIEISFGKDIGTERLGGRDFDLMHVELKVIGKAVKQKYYASIVKNYALACIASFTTKAEESTLDGVLATLTFD